MGTPLAQIGRNRQWYQLVVSWISAIFCFVYLLVCQDYEKITRLIIIKLGGRDPNHRVDTHIVQCLWLNKINKSVIYCHKDAYYYNHSPHLSLSSPT